MTRIIGPTGSKRRRRFRFLPGGMLLAALVALMVAGSAQAVHDLDVQLDGDVSHACPVFVGTLCTSAQKDWADLFNADGSSTSVINPAGPFTNGDFVRDFGVKVSATDTCSLTNTTSTTFCTADPTTYATGSKDTLDISGWACNKDNNVNSKIDIMNAYSVAYTRADGHKLLYFALEKNANNGTNDVGFWFLQGNANCDASGGGHPSWSGNHTDGDVLVVSEFTAGGGVSTIKAFKWSGGANGFLDVDHPIGIGIDCKNALAGDALCATTNSGAKPFNTNITTPWLTSDKRLGVGHTVVPPDFFEGGIDLTTAFGTSTVPACFNTFIGDTRSSAEPGATLFDFARGQLGECNVTMTTTPSTTSTALTDTGEVHDTANLVGHTTTGATAPSPGGTVNFFLCDPTQLDTSGTCSTGGHAVDGNPATVVKDTAPNSHATSGNVRSLITTIGTYCFRAEYSAGADEPNYPGQTAGTDNLADECFTVTGSASLSTAQNWLPNDTATISGDAAFSGSLTFNLYNSADCSGTAVYTEGPTAVSGPASGQTFSTSNTTYKVSLADANTGDYSWGVTYDDATLTDPALSCEPSSVSITAGG